MRRVRFMIALVDLRFWWTPMDTFDQVWCNTLELGTNKTWFPIGNFICCNVQINHKSSQKHLWNPGNLQFFLVGSSQPASVSISQIHSRSICWWIRRIKASVSISNLGLLYIRELEMENSVPYLMSWDVEMMGRWTFFWMGWAEVEGW